MTIEKLRDKVIGIVLDENKNIPSEFVFCNWDYLKTSVDLALNKSNKLLIKKNLSYAFLVIELLISLLLSYYLLKFLELSLIKTLAICAFTLLNIEMIYYGDFVKLFHKLFILFNYRVKNYCSITNFGYNIVYIGFRGKKIIVLPLNKIKKSVTLENPRLYIIHKDCLYSIIFDYLTNKKSSDLEFIKYEVFLSLNQEYINLRVLNELEEMKNL